MGLPLKQRLFVLYYLGKAGHNGTLAARMAGFSSPRQMATRLLSKASIREAIAEKVDSVAMETDEILARLSRQARSDMGDFLAREGTDPSEPPPFDFRKARRRDQLGNIKAIKRKTRTIPQGRDEEPVVEVTVELQVYDPRPALESLAKIRGIGEGAMAPKPPEEAPKRILIPGHDGRNDPRRDPAEGGP